jgi:topoisomerase IA-like protein
MSQPELSRFLTHALDDQNLRTTLASNPEQAFQGFDLTDEEKEAVRAADEQRLRDLGIDPMTARSWLAFHDTAGFAPDQPDAPGDLRPET